MARLVSLSDKAYNTLLKMKKDKESFSDIVMKLAESKKKKSIMRFAGIWKDDKEMDKIFKRILKERHETKYKEKDISW